MANYTNQANIEARIKRSLSADEVTYLPTLLNAIDQWINSYTGRLFIKEATDSVTEYIGNKKRSLYLKDDYQSISKVEAFDIYDTSEGEIDLTCIKNLPIGEAYIDELYYIDGLFADAIYKITGKKGYTATCPADITFVANELFAMYDKNKGGITNESIEGYSYAISVTLSDVVKSNPLVSNTLDNYKRILI